MPPTASSWSECRSCAYSAPSLPCSTPTSSATLSTSACRQSPRQPTLWSRSRRERDDPIDPPVALARQIGPDHPAELFELRQRLVPAVRRDVVDAALDARFGEPFDLARGGLWEVTDRDLSTPGSPRQLLQLRYALDHVATIRHPPVGVANDTLQDLGPAPADDDGRMGLLDRLRPAPHRPEIHQLAVVLGLLLGPDRLDGLGLFAQQLPPRAEVGAVVGHLLAVPTCADAENETAVRDKVDAGGFLRGVDRVALDQKAYAGSKPNRLRGRGSDRERDERIHGVPVVLGQVRAPRPRRLAAGRDVGMLGDPQRLEAKLLGGGRELAHRDRVVGRKDRDAELHPLIVTELGS